MGTDRSPYAQGPTMRDDRVAYLSTLGHRGLLLELLAVIHGDGGQNANSRPLAVAVADAEERWHSVSAAPEATHQQDLQVAPPAPPCDMGEICIGCTPRNPDGSCPSGVAVAPAEIWLQIDPDQRAPLHGGDVTWAMHPIHSTDVRYVRAAQPGTLHDPANVAGRLAWLGEQRNAGVPVTGGK